MTAKSLPGQPHFTYENGQLHVEKLPLAALARSHATPLFVYSKAAMLAALAAYQRGFSGRRAQKSGASHPEARRSLSIVWEGKSS